MNAFSDVMCWLYSKDAIAFRHIFCKTKAEWLFTSFDGADAYTYSYMMTVQRLSGNVRSAPNCFGGILKSSLYNFNLTMPRSGPS